MMRIQLTRSKVGALFCSVAALLSITTSNAEYTEPGATPFTLSRVVVDDESSQMALPFRAVGKVRIYTDDVDNECTGTLIGPSLILTAKHCTQDYERAGRTVLGEFTPAFHNGEAPFGVWSITSIQVGPGDTTGTENCSSSIDSCRDDVALLRIDSKQDSQNREYRLGEKIGWLPFQLDGYSLTNPHPPGLAAQVTRLGYYFPFDGGQSLQRIDTQSKYEPSLDLLIAPNRLPAPGNPSFTEYSAGGGPWVVNLGQSPANLDEEVAVGIAAQNNVVIAVDSIFNGTGEVAVTPLNQTNFEPIYDAICAQYPLDCLADQSEEQNDAIRVVIEEPAQGGVYSGVGNLRGWAIHDFPISRIEISIDDGSLFIAPYGGDRFDVGAVFPEIPNSSESGFGLAFGYGDLTPGPHTIKIRATAITGEYNEVTSSFEVQRFHKAFIAPEDGVSLDASTLSASGETIELVDVVVDGRVFDLTLKWDTATQDFDITEIAEKQR